ncbi:hypothetical protein GCM10008915_36590 [Bifidobacterium pullorum subsp. gallinarum]
MNTIRLTTGKVSLFSKNNTKNTRIVDAAYHGGIEEHEDIADYYSPELTLKGVRVG